MCDKDFISKYRLDMETFLHICDILHNDLQHEANGQSVGVQVLTALRLLGSGLCENNVQDEHIMQVSQSTLSRNLTRVVDALMKVKREHIKFPTTNQEKHKVQEEFYRYSGMPGVLGVVDIFQVGIIKPNEPDFYLNKNGTYTVKGLIVCDAKGFITYVEANDYGKSNDDSVWSFSLLRDYLDTCDTVCDVYDGYLVADNGFSSDPYTIRPFRKPANKVEIAFNNSVRNVRKLIEECTRNLKSRFCVLDSVMHYSHEMVDRIITACCVLHNICNARSVKLPKVEQIVNMGGISSFFPVWDGDDEDPLQKMGYQLRNNIALRLYNKSSYMNVDLADKNENQIDMETQEECQRDKITEFKTSNLCTQNEEPTVEEQRRKKLDYIAAKFFGND